MSEKKVDPNIERLWAEEIRARLKELDEGRTKPIPWSDVRASILANKSAHRSKQ